MSAWDRKGRASYAEFLPAVDLASTRWPAEEQVPEPTPLARPASGDQRHQELGEIA